ncbi:hypothetical protein BGX26_012433 [Mortierella sp. AD094]|nr:hypothetical protein BGX26_012433 [Mortierella sp. AD094]
MPDWEQEEPRKKTQEAKSRKKKDDLSPLLISLKPILPACLLPPPQQHRFREYSSVLKKTPILEIKLIVTEKESRAHVVNIGTDWSNNDNALQFPLVLSPRAAASYFVPREGFQISHLFANPMMLMMGFSLLMVSQHTPKGHPEAMEEIQGMQDATQMPSFEMPDIAATLAKFSTGGGSSPSSASKKK